MASKLTKHQDDRGTVRELTVHDSPPQNGVAERGMRTRAERARALLLSSGLPRFLWEEAMKHTTWLQNRTPTEALEGKTPYEMINKKKPHLAGIQEFGAAAYVKDLKAGKLDARAKVGRFVGYDSESKGCRIYWPTKRSITVERNVVFNQDDVHNGEHFSIPSGDTLSEGERDKVIQQAESNVRDGEKLENDSNLPVQPQSEDENPEKAQETDKPNTIPFPTVSESETQPIAETLEADEEPEPEYGRGKRARKPKGAYRDLDRGKPLTASLALEEELEAEDSSAYPSDIEDMQNYLPPDFALIGSLISEPASIDEAMRGPDAQKWQEALNYEISQLEKLGT